VPKAAATISATPMPYSTLVRRSWLDSAPIRANGSASAIIIATASGWIVGPTTDLRPIESTAPSSGGIVTGSAWLLQLKKAL
jgi:hypothetical protein